MVWPRLLSRIRPLASYSRWNNTSNPYLKESWEEKGAMVMLAIQLRVAIMTNSFRNDLKQENKV